MIYSTRCPHCQAVLKSPTPVPGGKKVKCPGCKQVFTTPDPETEPATPGLSSMEPKPTAPVPAVPSMSLDDDDEMAAAIAKLQGDTALGVRPAPQSKPAEDSVPEVDIPEVDDDLVVPDEEPADGEVEEDIPMEIIDEEEKPAEPKKGKKREDEEVDEEPRSKKKAREDDEEKITEKPAAAKRKTEVKEDEPASKRDKDDDTSKKKKKKAGNPMVLIGAAGGGVAALLFSCMCCCGGYFLFVPPVVGSWEPAEKAGREKLRQSMHFGYFGSGRFEMNGEIFGQTIEQTAYFNYKYSRGDPATLEITITRVEGKNADRFNKEQREPQKASVRFDGDSMIIGHDRDRGNFGGGMTWRRTGRFF